MSISCIDIEYINPKDLEELFQIFKKEMGTFEDINQFFFNVRDVDKSEDLEELNPEQNVSVNAILLFDINVQTSPEIKNRFPNTIEFVKKMPGVNVASCVAIAPNSIVPLHLDDMDRPAYDYNDWYAVLIGVDVPDSNLVGMKIAEHIYTHTPGTAIIFDTQMPHSAWNKTNDWWVTLRLSTNKHFFTNEN